MMSSGAFDPSTTLYPQERNQIIELWHNLQKKYLYQSDDFRTMAEFSKEAVDRFRKIGWEVDVDFSRTPDLTTGRVVVSPSIEIKSRIESREFDHDRMRYEVQHGALDGVEGTMKADGTISEPSSKNL